MGCRQLEKVIWHALVYVFGGDANVAAIAKVVPQRRNRVGQRDDDSMTSPKTTCFTFALYDTVP